MRCCPRLDVKPDRIRKTERINIRTRTVSARHKKSGIKSIHLMPLLNYAVHGTVPPVFIFRFEIREILILFSPESAVWKNELCYLFYQDFLRCFIKFSVVCTSVS